MVRFGGRELSLGSRTLIMGIVNCTPDSFFDGGRYTDGRAAATRYAEIVAAGADWVDVGGASTRPGAEPIAADEEWQRIAPVMEAARKANHPVPLSVDTTSYAVARRALDHGAVLINDISALQADTRLATLAGEYDAGLILMHMRGTPRTMQENPVYEDLIAEVATELRAAITTASEHGVDREQIIIDPGIGFGKTADHNLEIMQRLVEFCALDHAVLIGCSRKSFIGAVLDLPPEERLEGTLAAHAAAALAGAHIVRVHDVAAHRRALDLIDAILVGHLPSA